jgi:hypothetical protein
MLRNASFRIPELGSGRVALAQASFRIPELGGGRVPSHWYLTGGGKPLPYDLGYCAEYGLGCAP